MRVRPLRPSERRARNERRPHGFGREADETEPAPVADPAPAPEQQNADEHVAERRHRASVAPEDTAHYVCSCGFQFQASVSTSVACPHCGTAQAW
jgi:hypothetical protein